MTDKRKIKQLLLAFVFALLGVSAFSQGDDNRILPLPYKQAKLVLIDAYRYKIAKKQLDSLSANVNDLIAQRDRLTRIVAAGDRRDSLSMQQLALALDGLSKAQEEKKILDGTITQYSKALRRAQIGKKVIAGLGLTGIGLLTFLFMNK